MTKKINIITQTQIDDGDDFIEVTIGPKNNQQVFKASKFIPGLTLLNIIRATNLDDDAESSMVTIVYDFFNSIFIGEDKDAFFAYCADVNNKVSFEDLFDIFTKIFEFYTDERPTNG